MSDFTSKISELLSYGLTDPKSLDEQKGSINLVLDDLSNPTPNENNLLSLLTLRDLSKSDDDKDIINRIAHQETKHLISAMKILGQDIPENASTAIEKDTLVLQRKFGKDTKGSIALAKLIKDHENKDKFDTIIRRTTNRNVGGERGAIGFPI